MSRCELTDSYAIELSSACKTNSVLKKLYLAENDIGTEGLKPLAEMLETNYTLISLQLGGNKINNTSAQLFVEALKQNPVITSLSLYPKNIGEVTPAILQDIERLIKNNIKCHFKELFYLIKRNDPTITIIDFSLVDPNRISHYNETIKNEFKKALSENIYIKKLIVHPNNPSILEFCPIETCKYIEKIDLEEPLICNQGIERAGLIIKQLIAALDSNQNLIQIKFPKNLFKYRDDKEIVVNEKIQRNYKNYVANKKELICSLIVIAQGLRDKPLGGMPYDLLFNLLRYVFADNVVYQQMTRKKTFASFFNGACKSVEEISTKKQRVNIVSEIKL